MESSFKNLRKGIDTLDSLYDKMTQTMETGKNYDTFYEELSPEQQVILNQPDLYLAMMFRADCDGKWADTVSRIIVAAADVRKG